MDYRETTAIANQPKAAPQVEVISGRMVGATERAAQIENRLDGLLTRLRGSPPKAVEEQKPGLTGGGFVFNMKVALDSLEKTLSRSASARDEIEGLI